jgi:hypothetical protein
VLNQNYPEVVGKDYTGSYSLTLTNLTPDDTYYVNAFATNANGTDTGNTISFTTPSS